MFIDEKLQMIWDNERDMKLSVQKIYDTLVTEVVDKDNFFPIVRHKRCNKRYTICAVLSVK